MSGTMPLRMIIDGPPASGKGTQSEYICSLTNAVHVSTGDALRAEVKKGSELGQRAKRYMEEGLLVPDELVIGICVERLKQEDCVKNGWLLDGFPRTGSQAATMKEKGLMPDLFLQIRVTDDECVKRISGRRSDPETGNVYHIEYNPPPAEIASRCIQRSDDCEDVIRKRLAAYHSQCDSIVEIFEPVLKSINGMGTIEATKTQIKAFIDEARDSKKGSKN